MNRADKIFISIIIGLVFLSYVPLWIKDYHNKNRLKEVVVNYKNEEVLRVNLDLDGTYQVEGTLGTVDVEVKSSAVRVEKENSPYHLCSIQGWVKDTNRPIICLPNHIIVQIEAKDNMEGDLDTVIQ